MAPVISAHFVVLRKATLLTPLEHKHIFEKGNA